MGVKNLNITMARNITSAVASNSEHVQSAASIWVSSSCAHPEAWVRVSCSLRGNQAWSSSHARLAQHDTPLVRGVGERIGVGDNRVNKGIGYRYT